MHSALAKTKNAKKLQRGKSFYLRALYARSPCVGKARHLPYKSSRNDKDDICQVSRTHTVDAREICIHTLFISNPFVTGDNILIFLLDR